MWMRSTARSASPSERGRAPISVVLAAATLAAALFALTVASAAGPLNLAVVANPAVAEEDLSFAELRKIMLGDRQFWTSGQRITLIVRAPVAAERTILLEKVYRMSEQQYRQYWVGKVFRAEATSGPRVVLSNDEAVDLVGVLDGAITLVNAADVPEGLKILKIGGRLPGEEGYPLK